MASPAGAAHGVAATEYAHTAIRKGSQSFSAAARLLPADVRNDVVRLYAWCRHCDDVIDGQTLGHGENRVADPAAALAGLTAKTDAALAGTVLGDPVFDGFGAVARERGITPRLAHDLLDGFAEDVAEARYETFDDLCRYCYGVAGAVGVMMALVLRVPPEDRDTLDRACDLGLAFQMTNIARDVIADARIGRVYLPADWLTEAGVEPTPSAVAAEQSAPRVFRAAMRLVEAAEPYYASADVGVARLPFRTAWAIAAAGRVYRAIGRRRRAAGPEGLGVRARTTRTDKAVLIAKAGIAAASRRERDASRHGMWTRPVRP